MRSVDDARMHTTPQALARRGGRGGLPGGGHLTGPRRARGVGVAGQLAVGVPRSVGTHRASSLAVTTVVAGATTVLAERDEQLVS